MTKKLLSHNDESFTVINQSLEDVLLSTMNKYKPPLAAGSYEDVLNYIGNIFYDSNFLPNDEISYDAFLEVLLEVSYTTVGNMSKGSLEWKKVARVVSKTFTFENFLEVLNQCKELSTSQSAT